MAGSAAEMAGLAVSIADDAAVSLVACALELMPGDGGWMSTTLPHGTDPGEAGEVRRALRYLHLRGLITDHPMRPWVRLAPPDNAAPRKRGRMALRVAAR